jgi:xylulokinase
MAECLLGVDVGTSSTKGAVIDNNGKLLAEAWVEHGIEIPKPGWAEQDAEEIWWNDFKKICKLLFEKIEPGNIKGVGVSGLCPDMLPVDKEGKPLRKAILYGIDRRASREIKEIEEKIGKKRIFEVCGNTLQAQSVGPKILWFKKHEPELFEKTHKILSASNYVVYKLTGEYSIERFTASFFHPLFDITRLNWNEHMVKELDLPLDILPDVKWSTELTGSVTKEAAKETGLVEGTGVITGMCDAIGSVMSTGLEKEGEICIFMGTTTCLLLVLDRKVTHPLLWSIPYYKSGKYIFGGGTSTSGAIVAWFRENFCPEKSYEELDEEAERIEPGANGLVMLPYFMGERTPVLDERARGIIFGLTISHNRSHVYRAVLEATAYCIKHHFDVMKEKGVFPERVLIVDGGAKSVLWRQIISDVINMPVEYIPKALGAPFGDAYAAGMGMGMFKDLDLLREMNSVKDVRRPREKEHEKYMKHYSVFRSLYKKTKEEMHDLSDAAEKN